MEIAIIFHDGDTEKGFPNHRWPVLKGKRRIGCRSDSTVIRRLKAEPVRLHFMIGE